MVNSESNKIEYKRELIADIDKEIIAFLNSQGGTIYIGLNDDGTIYKEFLTIDKNKLDLKIGNILQNSIFPSAYRDVSFNYNKDGILEININEGTHKPYYLREKGPVPSGVYLRVGASKRNASEEEIIKMMLESSNYDYELDISINQDLTFNQLSLIFNSNDLILDDKAKRNFGILNKNNFYTNLGFILSDQSSISVKLAEYDQNLNFKIKKTFTGSLIKILDEVQEQTNRLNDVSAVIDGISFRRKEMNSYPSVALREIILNAFCHSDYTRKSNIKIEFFIDKVIITSPGGIYDATFEEILEGTQTYRNPKLVHLLDKLNYIENFGSGIRRTFESYTNTTKEPLFKPMTNFLIVELPKINNNTTKVKKDLNINLSQIGKETFKLIMEKPGLKVNDLLILLKNNYKELNLDKVIYILKNELKEYI